MSLRIFLLFTIFAYYRITNCDEATTTTEPKAKNQPSPARLKAEGNAAFENRDYAKALKYYEQLVEIQPDHYENWHLVGLVHFLKDNCRAAIDDWTQCINLNNNFADGYFYRGKAYKKIGECSKALSDFNKAHQLDTKNDKLTSLITETRQCVSNYEKAMNLLNNHDCNAAEPIVEELLQISPFDSKLNFGITYCHFKQKNYQQVLKYTGNILRENSQNLEALLLRGQAYYYLGEFEMAKKHYSAGLKSDPDHKMIKEEWKKLKNLLKYIETGDEYFNQKKYKLSIEEYEKALKIDENLLMIQKDLKFKCCKTSVHDSNIPFDIKLKYCNEALEIHNNDHAESFYWRGKIYKEQKNWEKAAHDFEQASQRDRQNRQYQEELQSIRLEEKKAKRKDYYQILGITQDASQREIKKAFRKCGLEHHPDQHANASDEERERHENIFKNCVEASDILSDPEKKAKYDRGEDVMDQMQGGQGFQGFHGFPGGFPFHGFQQGGQQQQGGQRTFTFRFGG